MGSMLAQPVLSPATYAPPPPQEVASHLYRSMYWSSWECAWQSWEENQRMAVKAKQVWAGGLGLCQRHLRLCLENASPGHTGGSPGEENRAGYRPKVWVLKVLRLVGPEGEEGRSC